MKNVIHRYQPFQASLAGFCCLFSSIPFANLKTMKKQVLSSLCFVTWSVGSCMNQLSRTPIRITSICDIHGFFHGILIEPPSDKKRACIYLTNEILVDFELVLVTIGSKYCFYLDLLCFPS